MQTSKPALALLLILLLPASHAFAQLCRGSLGDPVVNITFGTGSSSQQVFAPANYTYTSSTCPNDGQYTLTGTTPGCFGSSWHYLSEDHTPGDINGLMMLINAAPSPGDFYVDTVENLCPNTTYEFAAWIINVLNNSGCQGHGANPVLTFTIEQTDHTVLKSFSSDEIPRTFSPQWKQYGAFFTTPAGISRVVIRLRNNVPGGNNCGNDLALDDITFRPCGPDVNVSINGANGKDTIDFCEDETHTYLLNGSVSSGYDKPVLQWQFSNDEGTTWTDINGAQSASYSATESAVGDHLYRLSVVDAANIASKTCRINSNIVNLSVNPLPVINATSNSPVCGNENLTLTAHNAASYHWSGPNNFSSTSDSITITQPSQLYAGNYFVTAITNKGCSGKDSLQVGIFPAAVADAGNNITICEGSSTQLQGTGAGAGKYEWAPLYGLSSTTVATPFASPTNSTVYTLQVTDGNGCQDTDSVAVNVLSKPGGDAGPNKVIFEGQSTQLQATIKGDSVSFVWQPFYNITNPGSLTPTVHPTQDTTYFLVVNSMAGCGTFIDKVFVRVYKQIKVPNAFSPNGDGINDTWRIEAIETYPECEVTIFNRYGVQVFASRGYPVNWNGTHNGKPLPVGTYYYVIVPDRNVPKLTGSVTILK